MMSNKKKSFKFYKINKFDIYQSDIETDFIDAQNEGDFQHHNAGEGVFTGQRHNDIHKVNSWIAIHPLPSCLGQKVVLLPCSHASSDIIQITALRNNEHPLTPYGKVIERESETCPSSGGL